MFSIRKLWYEHGSRKVYYPHITKKYIVFFLKYKAKMSAKNTSPRMRQPFYIVTNYKKILKISELKQDR